MPIGDDTLSDKYVFIGGTALMLLSRDADFGEIRATRDYDIVLLVKDSVGNRELFQRMWEYIDEGEYKVFKTKEGAPQYYRFTEPSNTDDFPVQLEFFSNAPEFIAGNEERFTPLHVADDIQSLSSIIMDDTYYNFIVKQRRRIQDVISVTELGLIALKARAYNDLLERKEIDPRISSKNIDKHKKDIARVLDFISPVEICDLSEYSEIQNDLKKFIVNLEKEHSKKPEIKAGNTTTTVDEIKSSLEKHFGIF